jgi:signal transduction histidine kinase
MATNRALEDLRKLGERVQAAELALDEARRRRDDAIREVRRSTDHTVPEIADAAGVSQATVKTVLRGVR